MTSRAGPAHAGDLRRAGGLGTAQIAGLGCAFLASLVAARALGPTDFGRLAFVQSVVGLSGLLFEFGTALAAGRLIALETPGPGRADLAGAWVLLFAPIGAAYALLLGTAPLWIDAAFGLDVGRTMVLVALPAVAIPYQTGLRELLQGGGNVGLLSALNAAPFALYLAAVSALAAAGRATLATTALAYFCAIALAMAGVTVRLAPAFGASARRRVRDVAAETRTFGIHAFVGRVIGTGTFQLDSPMIAFFSRSPAAVGFYSLAKSLASPISIFARSLATVLYPAFARRERIASGTVRATALWLAAAGGALAAFGPTAVHVVFGPGYAEVSGLLRLWALVGVVQGAYQLPNVYLSAAGQGRVLRTMATVFAVVNVALNAALIPRWGAAGATVASGGSYTVWLVLSWYHYRRFVHTSEDPRGAQTR